MKAKIGVWSFIVGLLIAIIVAIFSAQEPPVEAIFVLAVLGLIVGLLNIKDKEIQLFLVAAIAFLMSFQALSYLFRFITLGWTAVATFFNLLNVFIAPAAAIVAMKALFSIAKD